MKKCFTINCMRKKNDFEGYKSIIDNNIYQAIEIFYPYNVDNEQREFYTKEISQLVKRNIEVVLHLPHGRNNDLLVGDNDDSLQRMKDAIDYARMFHATKLTLHLGAVPTEITRQESLEKLVPILKDLSEYSKGMYLMIENMPGEGELGYSPSEILWLINKVECRNLKFILDTGHAHCSIYPIEEYILSLKEYLTHIHFSDNSGLRDEHKRINSGTIDFVSVFKALNAIGYNELCCMEVIFKEYTDLIEYAEDIDKYINND